MKALLFVSSLTLFAADVPSPEIGHPGLPLRLVGKLLVLSVKVGMTEDQVVAVFGHPDATWGETRGQIGEAEVYRSSTWSYLRYGVTAHFTTTWRVGDEVQRGVRVYGEIQ